MPASKLLRDAILLHTIRYESRVSACGVRYGSVLYIAFGEGLTKPHLGRASTTKYSVELEVGSDSWVLTNYGDIILDSEFSDIERARDTLNGSLLGRKMLDIEVSQSESTITFDGNMKLKSGIVPAPASGFLYSFQAKYGPTWETLNGVTIQD